MRIGMILDGSYPNDIRVRKEAESLVENGKTVLVICPKKRGDLKEEIINGVLVYRIGNNYTHFKNFEFDKLYEMAQQETNDSTRYHYYREMDKILIEEAPVVPLYYDEVVRLIQKNVIDLGINPVNLLSLKRVKKN